MRIATLALVVLLPTAAAEATTLTPCFTPGQDCTGEIVAEIGTAKVSLLVQAYSFTSTPIIDALAVARARGVLVNVILDASNESDKYSGATYLLNHGVVPLIDYKPAIAHNKVMVIDGKDVITGSFNFTAAAQRDNAENVLIVRDDPALAKAYTDNWQSRAFGVPALHRAETEKRQTAGRVEQPRRNGIRTAMRTSPCGATYIALCQYLLARSRNV